MKTKRSQEQAGRDAASSVQAGEAWARVQRGEAETLDLRTNSERRRYGWPPGSTRVSLVRHSVRPRGPATIYLCQHANRSKLTLRHGPLKSRTDGVAGSRPGCPSNASDSRPLSRAVKRCSLDARVLITPSAQPIGAARSGRCAMPVERCSCDLLDRPLDLAVARAPSHGARCVTYPLPSEPCSRYMSMLTNKAVIDGATNASTDSLTITDNRTGLIYEVPIEDRTIRASLLIRGHLPTQPELEKIALEDLYFVKRKLYPNVDFYSRSAAELRDPLSVRVCPAPQGRAKPVRRKR